jgi:sugar (pentulose or hexulose) kinase
MTEQYFLGIEFGSTRIKAVLIDGKAQVASTGSYTWENQLVDGYWTYALEEAWTGVQVAYAQLVSTLAAPPTTFAGIGISAMMHGYLAFDEADDLLVPFRTWRNTTTAQASSDLTTALDFTIPQRWSIAHLYQAVLSGEDHVSRVAHLTTLAGYIHWKLTGERVVGVGEASGMFPIGLDHQWDTDKIGITQSLLDKAGVPWKLIDLLPQVKDAGVVAGHLSAEGAALLDPTGTLQPGVPFAPPEGDAGTGMVATNAVAPRTGNISAGTSLFLMAVLEKPLERLHPEIDLVTTPSGDPVAMVHCNNGASEIDAWAGVFAQFAAGLGSSVDKNAVFATLFNAALEGDADCGGLLAYNYLAGEPITGLSEGRPLIVRTPDSRLTLANLARTLILSSFGTLSLGMRILDTEGATVDSMFAHGGIFATPGVAQRLMAAALKTPITVGSTASEGGAWGMAVLAAYSGDSRGLTLAEYLDSVVFAGVENSTVAPDSADVVGYEAFLTRYEKGLTIEAAAVAGS